MGLYKDDNLSDNPKEYPASGDAVADDISRFALTYLFPLIQIVIYSGTQHNKSLTAQICNCNRRSIERLINTLAVKSGQDIIILNLDTIYSVNNIKQLPNHLENIRSVVRLIQPFLPHTGGNPGHLGVTVEQLNNTIKVLRQLTLLLRSSSK